ncbi:Pantothenic acid transporter PanT [anaerobic digester metagenome]
MKSQQTHYALSMQKESTRDLVLLAMLSSILLLLAFTPIGLVDLPFIKATILHLPVIIGSILIGPYKGMVLGFVFGLTSLIKNTIAPSLLSFAFSPFIPVPGMDRGSPWALVICFVPRILVGVVPWIVYNRTIPLFQRWFKNRGNIGLILSSILGSLTNTILVMTLIFIIFREAYALVSGILVEAVLDVILGVVAVNGIPEAVLAAVLVPVITVPLLRILRKGKSMSVNTEPRDYNHDFNC